MAGRFLASSASSASSRSSVLVRPFADSHLGQITRYSRASGSEKEGSVKKSGRSDDFIGERAPSTAKEFEKVAEQKLREAEKGRESQTKSEEKAAKKSG